MPKAEVKKMRRYAAPAAQKEDDEELEDFPPPGNEKEPARPPAFDDDAGEAPGNARARPRSEKGQNEIVALLNESESTTRDSPYWAESYEKPHNPDDLVKKYHDYRIYDKEMLNDDQVNVCLELKKDLVLGSGYEFVCDDSGEEVEDDLAAPEDGEVPPPEEKKPYAFGDEQEEGEMPDMSGMDDEELDPEAAAKEEKKKAEKAQMLCIKKDLEVAFGEDPDVDIEESFAEILTAYEIGFSLTEKVWKKREDGKLTIKSLKTRHPSTWRIHTDKHGNIEKFEQHTPDGPIKVKAEALIHYINNRRYGNVYGRSDLRAAYDAWFIKREIVKYYAIWLEKSASPIPVAKYPTNSPPEVVTELFNVIKRFQTKTAITIPDNVEIDFLESKSNGEAYVKAINLFNMFIGRALFIPDLLGFQGGETSGGSYSLGKDQMLVLYKHIEKRRKAFEKLVNMHLVRPFVLANYGFVEKYPKFRLKEISDEKAGEYAKLWLEAVKGKAWKPTDEEINFFRKLIKFPVGPVEREKPPSFAPPTLPDGSPNPGHPANAEEGEDMPPKMPPTPVSGAGKKPKPFSKVFDGTPGEYGKKVNFKLLRQGLDGGIAKVMDEGKPLIREIYDDLFKQIRDKKILQAQDLGKIEKIKVKKLASLRALLKRRFMEIHRDMYAQAKGEIIKGAQKYAAPLPNEDFLDFLDEETFQYVGDFEYGIKKKVRIALAKAIKDGEPMSAVLDVLDDEGIALSTTSLERYARTKFTEVMNRARREAFEETGVVAAYQFTAIMDDRVSEICGGLHGAIFDKDNAPNPPLHFNCRSALIPITKYEDFKVTKSVEGQNIDKFIDENIGDGFSRQ